METSSLQVLDYVVFGFFLSISILIGIFFAFKARRKQRRQIAEARQNVDLRKVQDGEATEDFLMGGRKMPMVPIALSLLTSFLSGILLLGTPAEIYLRGSSNWLIFLSGSVSFLLAGLFFIPIFNQGLGLPPDEANIYSPLLRKIASGIFLINSLFYLAVVIFSPSVALEGVTGVQQNIWIAIVGILCTIYTSIGGLKAVVWTDALQAIFMYGGILVMLARGVYLAGGMETVWQTFVDNGRISDMTNFDISPFQYISMWIAIFGGVFYWLGGYGLNQMALQRYCSLPSQRHANIVLAMTVPMFIIMCTLTCFIAVVMFAFFNSGCDPTLDPDVHIKGDQLVILFAVKTLSALPGMAGLFLAALFSATFSTVSSAINSQSAVVWEDFVKPHFGHRFTDSKAATLNKVLSLMFGALATAAAFSSGPIGGIIKACVAVVGATSGPLVGCFLLGMCIPWANKIGAFVALAIGMAINVTTVIGNIVYAPYRGYRMSLNDTCLEESMRPNVTDVFGDQTVPAPFRTSIYLYSLIGITVTITVGTIVSTICPVKHQSEHLVKKQRQLTIFRARNVTPEEFYAQSDTQVFDIQMQAVNK